MSADSSPITSTSSTTTMKFIVSAALIAVSLILKTEEEGGKEALLQLKIPDWPLTASKHWDKLERQVL